MDKTKQAILDELRGLIKDCQNRYELSNDDIVGTVKGMYDEKTADQLFGEFVGGKKEEPEEE